MKLEISYNLVVGNNIESTYELLFAVLPIHVFWDLLQCLEYGDIYLRCKAIFGEQQCNYSSAAQFGTCLTLQICDIKRWLEQLPW